MKIIIVTPYFNPHVGGVESYTLNIARQLKTLGWEVVIVTTDKKINSGAETFEGMRIYRLRVLFTVSNTPVGIFWRSKLKKIYKAESPDLINGHVPVPFFADAAERCRGNIPFVLTYHNDLEKDNMIYKPIIKLLNRAVVNRTLKRSNQVIATSEYYVNQSRSLKPYKNKIKIIPPGVDLECFNPKVSTSDISSKYKNQRIILFVGSLNMAQRHKGLDFLIDAFSLLCKEFNDIRLVVVGRGDAIDYYKTFAEKIGVADTVEFTGYVENKLLPQYFKQASVFAMPSSNANEGFGMVFMEASAVGTPVIGTKVGGIPYAVKDKVTGLLVKPRNVTTLKKALRSILSDDKYAKSLGRAGAERAKEFSWNLLAIKTDTIFRQAAKPTIIQVAGYYPPHLGGMERVAQSLSEQLATRDYQVQVLTSSINSRPGKTNPHPNLSIKRFKALEFAHIPIAPGFTPAILKIPRNSIIHLHLAQAFYPEFVLLSAKLRRIPYVVHFHLDLQPSGPLGFLFVIYKAVFIKLAITNADAVVVFSSDQQNLINKKYGVTKEKISIIPNGVGEEYYLPIKDYSDNKSYNLLYVGRISNQKRVNMLVEAMPLLKTRASLTIVGDGDERIKVEKYAHDNKIDNVRFEGQKSPLQTLPYYKSADAFVMASKIEGMPLVLLEAMAASLPAIGSKVEGITEVLADVGVLVDKPTPQRFASQLDKILASPKELHRLSNNSSVAAQDYSWSKLTDSFELLYARLKR